MNLVFDLGKVVFDWEPRALVARLLPEHAPDDAAAEALEADFFQGFRGDWGEFDRGAIDADALSGRIARRTGIALPAARSVVDAVPHELHALPEMRALLERLHRVGVPLFFLSNMPKPYADVLETAHPFLCPGREGVFRDGIFSGRVGLIKPEPAIFALAPDRFRITAAATLFIDDLEANVDAARTAGWGGLRFDDAGQCERELQRLGVL